MNDKGSGPLLSSLATTQREVDMKRALVFLLAVSLFLVTPAVASARGGGPHSSQATINKEKVVIYKTTQQRDHRYQRSDRRDYRQSRNYYRSDRRDYRQSRNYYRPPRHAPAHGYYKKHPTHRHQSKKVVKHRAPTHKSSVIIGVPSIVIRIGL